MTTGDDGGTTDKAQTGDPTDKYGKGKLPDSTVSHDPQGIGWAVKQMHNGSQVTRRGWNGRGMWLKLQVPDAHSKMSLPYVYMHTVQGDLVPWLCSQTDLLATDWVLAD